MGQEIQIPFNTSEIKVVLEIEIKDATGSSRSRVVTLDFGKNRNCKFKIRIMDAPQTIKFPACEGYLRDDLFYSSELTNPWKRVKK